MRMGGMHGVHSTIRREARAKRPTQVLLLHGSHAWGALHQQHGSHAETALVYTIWPGTSGAQRQHSSHAEGAYPPFQGLASNLPGTPRISEQFQTTPILPLFLFLLLESLPQLYAVNYPRQAGVTVRP